MITNIVDALAAYRNGSANSLSGGAKIDDATGASFGDELSKFVGDAVNTIKKGEKASIDGALGKAGSTEVILAVNNAELMLQTVSALRDKVISAYQEIMRMGV